MKVENCVGKPTKSGSYYGPWHIHLFLFSKNNKVVVTEATLELQIKPEKMTRPRATDVQNSRI